VTNVGSVPGREVVQVYLDGGEGMEMKKFQKTKELKPGESTVLKFAWDERDLSRWDTESGKWVKWDGGWKVGVGGGSRDIRLVGGWE